MFTTYKATALAGLVASVAAFDCSGPYFSFYNRGGNSVSYQSLDPAVNPGVKSTHLHSFDGGNVLSSSMGFADTQQASCTTNRIIPDKSSYWRPTLFWNGNNTGYYRVPDKFVKIYYKFMDAGQKATVSEFPEDFMMFAGNPTARSENSMVTNMKWSCMKKDTRFDAKGFPKGFTSCENGFAVDLTFPSCWNGNPIDPANPHAHMAYPSGGGKGLQACPAGFQKERFPEIFMEFWYDVSQFDGQYSENDVPWVLSNGDPTGYGFHADFLNGWEKGVLAKATSDDGYCNCGCGCGPDQMKQCFGAENVNNDGDDAFKSCSAQPEFPGEDSKWMETLPGCNPIQAGPDDAKKQTGSNCGGGAMPQAPKPSAIASVVESVASSVADVVSSAVEAIATKEAVPSAAEPEVTKAAEEAPSQVPEPDDALTFQLPSSVASAVVVPPASSSAQQAAQTPAPVSPVAPSKPANFAEGAAGAKPSAANPPATAPPAAAPPAQAGNGNGSNEEQGQCAAVKTVTTQNVVYVTLAPGQPIPTGECLNTATVWTTIQEVVTVTVQPPAPSGQHYKRHLEQHKHHHQHHHH